MRLLMGIMLLLTLTITACSTYELKDLYGEWKGEVWAFTFNEDMSCTLTKDGNTLSGSCTYRTVGNALEFVRDGAVFMSNVTVKGIEGDVLTIELRPGSETEIHKLNRVK